MTTKFKFNLFCPRCNKTSEHISEQRIPPPHVNCGDCLMDTVEIVEMKVAAVSPTERDWLIP